MNMDALPTIRTWFSQSLFLQVQHFSAVFQELYHTRLVSPNTKFGGSSFTQWYIVPKTQQGLLRSQWVLGNGIFNVHDCDCDQG